QENKRRKFQGETGRLKETSDVHLESLEIQTHNSSSSSSVVNDSLRVFVWDKVCDSIASFARISLGPQATKAQLCSLKQSFVESKRLLAETNAAVEMINYGGSGGMDFSGIDVALRVFVSSEFVEHYPNCALSTLIVTWRIGDYICGGWDFSKIIKLNFEQFGSMDGNNKALALDPLIGAIAAPACSALLANTIPSYMDYKAIMVVEGGASVGNQLLDQKWDKIFFTAIKPIFPRVLRVRHADLVKDASMGTSRERLWDKG
ncbi:hypothetical protein GIB67_030801, partial [Kingdonia uniflora]